MDYRLISGQGVYKGRRGDAMIYSGYTIEAVPKPVILLQQDNDDDTVNDPWWSVFPKDAIVAGISAGYVIMNPQFDISRLSNISVGADGTEPNPAVVVQNATVTSVPKLYGNQAWGTIKGTGVSDSDVQATYIQSNSFTGTGGGVSTGGGTAGSLLTLTDDKGKYFLGEDGAKNYFFDFDGNGKKSDGFIGTLEGTLGDLWAWVQDNKVIVAIGLGGLWLTGGLNFLWKAVGLKGLIRK